MAGFFTSTVSGVTKGNLAEFSDVNGDIKDSGISAKDVKNILQAPSPPIPSPNGALSPPLLGIVNGSGTLYTIINKTGYQNGIADGGLNMDYLLYWNGLVYTYGSTIGWWVYVGGHWTSTSGDPRLG